MEDRHLFRGKRIDKNEWWEGHYITDLNGRAYISQTVKSFDVGNIKNSGRSLSAFTEIDPQTLGQSTGLRDKSGLLIYEGDILQSPTGNLVIKYGGYTPESFIKYLQAFRKDVENNLYGLFGEYISDNEQCILPEDMTLTNVIGNIHDNPELLEEE